MYEDEHGVMYVNDNMSLYHVSRSLYPPQTLFVVGYTVFTLSVCACVRTCVRPSVRP